MQKMQMDKSIFFLFFAFCLSFFFFFSLLFCFCVFCILLICFLVFPFFLFFFSSFKQVRISSGLADIIVGILSGQIARISVETSPNQCSHRNHQFREICQFWDLSVRNLGSVNCIYIYICILYMLYLVGGLELFLFFHILGIIIPTNFHIFQRGRYTTNQIYNVYEFEFSRRSIFSPWSIPGRTDN